MGITTQLLLRREIRDRHRNLFMLLARHVRGDLAKAIMQGGALTGPQPAGWDKVGESSEEPQELAREIEKLGPAAVKLGQMLSVQSDLIPPAYAEALEKLQNDIEPFSFEDVRQTLEEDLGAPLAELYRSFEVEPTAAASIGQVHRAIAWGGEQVAIKILRPNIRQQVIHDFEAFELLAETAERHLDGVSIVEPLASCRRTMLRETDYTQEARNTREVEDAISDFDALVVPKVHEALSSTRVLTLQFFAGEKITELSAERLAELDGDHLANQLTGAYLHQVLVAGVFHADPHPGNLILLPDNRIALIDLGLVGRVGPRLREQLLLLVLALADGRGERVARQLLDMGQAPADLDHHSFIQAITRIVVSNSGSDISETNFGQIMLSSAQTCQQHKVRLPEQIPMVGRTLSYLDQVIGVLAPDFNPTQLITKQAASLVGHQVSQDVTSLNALDRALRVRDLGEQIPANLGRLLDLATQNQLSFKVDALDEKELMRGLQKIANRVAAGAVLASMIVGAALIMNIESDYVLFGYPALAIVMFVAAGIGGAVMVGQSLIKDH